MVHHLIVRPRALLEGNDCPAAQSKSFRSLRSTSTRAGALMQHPTKGHPRRRAGRKIIASVLRLIIGYWPQVSTSVIGRAHSNRASAYGRAESHSAEQRIPRSHSSASLRSRAASARLLLARASLRYRTARRLLMSKIQRNNTKIQIGGAVWFLFAGCRGTRTRSTRALRPL